MFNTNSPAMFEALQLALKHGSVGAGSNLTTDLLTVVVQLHTLVALEQQGLLRTVVGSAGSRWIPTAAAVNHYDR